MFRLTALSMAVALAACGGGGDSNEPGGITPPTEVTPPAGQTPPGELPPPAVVNAAPVAHAGATQNVVVGETVILDGTASVDADKDELVYRWQWLERPAGSQAELSSTSVVRPSFVADVPGQYVLGLIVSDGKAESELAQVSIQAAAGNAAPVANAGIAQSVSTGSMVQLDGSASVDADGDELQFAWTLLSKPDGSLAALQNAGSATPSFMADVDGEYRFSLVVSDGSLSSEAVEVVISASTQNVPPIAQPGKARTVAVNETVQLDASASTDANGDRLSYLWSFSSKPEGSNATLSLATDVRPSFVADVAGDYVLNLVVNDGRVDSEPAVLVVTAVDKGISLFQISDSWLGAPSETLRSWPFSATTSQSASVFCTGSGCATDYSLARFKLEAQGQSYTITGLTATSSLGTVKASFDGLRNNQVIQAGESITFALKSDFTKGAVVNVKYAFTIKETGERFNYSASLKTN